MSSPSLLRGRNSEIGAMFAVTTITQGRRVLFADLVLANVIGEHVERCGNDGLVETHAWIAMPDHVHWLFELRRGSLSRCMQALKSRSARAINVATGESGPIWQAGFYDHRLRDDEDLFDQARYLVMNPVRRGLVNKVEDYPFWRCRWIERSTDL